MKKLILSVGVAVAVVAAAFVMHEIKAQAQSIIQNGYPLFIGGFQGVLPLTRVANPITTSGVFYTNPPQSGFFELTVITTNNASCVLSNATTGAYIPLGANASSLGQLFTNFTSVSWRVGPNEVLVVSNVTGVSPVTITEWRN